jgi:hypothetical protein
MSEAISKLQEIYGGPEVRGLGSSVIEVPLDDESRFESTAKERYRVFCGEIWERFGPENWLGQWAEVYRRPTATATETATAKDVVAAGGIEAELRGLEDHAASMAGSLMLDNIDDADAAEEMLKRVFDDPAIRRLSIYRLGDGEAIFGVMIAALAGSPGRMTMLITMSD